jgi:hypothetical protein
LIPHNKSKAAAEAVSVVAVAAVEVVVLLD